MHLKGLKKYDIRTPMIRPFLSSQVPGSILGPPLADRVENCNFLNRSHDRWQNQCFSYKGHDDACLCHPSGNNFTPAQLVTNINSDDEAAYDDDDDETLI